MRSRPFRGAPRRVAAAAWALLLATLAVALPLLAVGPPRAGAVRAASGAGTRGATPFGLADQSEWVGPPTTAQAGTASPSGAPFHLELSVRHPPSGALVDAVLYPRLRSRFAFKTVVHDGPKGQPLAETTPVALLSLPADARDAGAVSFDLSVVQAASTRQGTRIGLACTPPTGTGTCTGVYPLVVRLERPDGKVLHRFTTFLTYVSGTSAHPLELAWVVPITSAVSLTSDPSGPAGDIKPLTNADASALETLVSEIKASSVPLTLDVSPETLQQLELSGPDGRAADSALAGLSVDPASDEVLARPYVPVDIGALAGAGEPTEITAQMAAGATVLHRLRVETTASPSPWVQSGAVGEDIAAGLARVGATELVLPDVDLAPTSNATNVGTWAATFSLTLSSEGHKTSVKAAETDTWLDRQFTSLRDDPALAATQVLADLAMVHFERPNTTAVRGMVALPPARWIANPVFDRVLLDGLTKNPVVESVTLSQFFATVAADGARQLLASGTGPVLKRSVAGAVSHARARLSDFDDAVAGRPRPPVLSELDDMLLASESDGLSASHQAAGLSTVERAITDQLTHVKLATEQTFTLTARTGWIPITIESSAPYTVVGTLSVSGNKFVFPHKRTRRFMKLEHATNLWRVDVYARTSGDLPLDVTFTSPNGRLVIARGVLTVRSTATSVVGVVLTVLALAVLLIWWARTWRSGRRRRLRRAAISENEAAAR
jgi:hypothetical protein